MKSTFIFTAVLSLFCSILPAQEEKTPVKKEAEEKKEEKVSYRYSGGVKRPYVIHQSPTDGFFYIGSTIGREDSKDGQAQITVLAFEDFEQYELKRFQKPVIISTEYPKTVFDSPRGIVTFGEYIITTDFDALAIFKKVEKGLPEQIGRLKIDGAKELESIIKVDDSFYMTDSAANGIFKVTGLMDPKERKITPLTKIPSPKGMIYDAENNALLVVSSKVNKLFEYNLEDAQKSKSYTLAPEPAKDAVAGYKGFQGLCMGNQKEIYLTHYKSNMIMIYFRDQDRPATVPKPMPYAKMFLKDIRTPTSIIYEKTLNRIAFTQHYYNVVMFHKGLPAQLTDDILNKDIKVDDTLELEKKSK